MRSRRATMREGWLLAHGELLSPGLHAPGFGRAPYGMIYRRKSGYRKRWGRICTCRRERGWSAASSPKRPGHGTPGYPLTTTESTSAEFWSPVAVRALFRKQRHTTERLPG